MGWSFRRSLKFGPVRVNLSKSGVGYSIGGKGLRVGRDARGRSYRSASLPGTGIYSRSYGKPTAETEAPRKGGAGCLGLAVVVVILAAILSALFGGSKATATATPAVEPTPVAAPPTVQRAARKHPARKRAKAVVQAPVAGEE